MKEDNKFLRLSMDILRLGDWMFAMDRNGKE